MLSRQLVAFAFQDAMDKVTSWDDRLLSNLGRSVTSSVNSWLVNHPFFYWLVNHPLISLLIALIAIVLIVRLAITIYRAIASMIDRMWLWILRSPFLLLKFLFGWEVKPKNVPVNSTITNYEITNNPEQLQEIMTRLDTIQQQQQQILEDIAQLKDSQAIPKQIKLVDQKLIS